MAKLPLLQRLGTAIAVLGGQVETKSAGGYMDELLQLLSLRTVSKSGASVSVESALKVATVSAICRVIGDGVGGMPWKLQRRFADGRREFATDMPLYNILYRRPNEWQTSFEFREHLMLHALLTGNAFAYISRDGAGRITELLPITPSRVKILQDSNTNVTYEIRDGGKPLVTLRRADVFHLRGPSWDGVRGLDAVSQAREAIGLSMAVEESQSNMQRNGLKSSGIISLEGSLRPEGADRLREKLKAFKEEDNSGVLILDQSAKFQSLQQTGADSQLLETRRFQIEEICRAFRVFPQMIGHAERSATYASAEQFFLAHVIHTLMPWVQRWEETAHRDLLADDSDQGEFELIAKMSMQGLMRGDAATRAGFYASGIVNGWMTRADARELEDMPAIPGLDVPLTPLNMGPGPNSTGATAQNANDKQPVTGAMVKLLAAELAGSFAGADLAEIEAKIGRILSTANEQRIQQARDLLDEVLAKLAAANADAPAV